MRIDVKIDDASIERAQTAADNIRVALREQMSASPWTLTVTAPPNGVILSATNKGREA